jgi:hypothetical protein
VTNQSEQPASARGAHATPAGTSPTRRRLLGWTAGGGAALVGAFLTKGLGTKSVQAQTSPSIVGSWVITFPQNGPDSDPNEHQVISFTSDGIVLNANLPSSPPDPQQGPNATRTYSTEGQGAWVVAGAGQFRLKFVSVNIDEQGNFAGLVQITATLTLSADGNSFTGSFQVLVKDAAGNVQFDSQGDAGTVQGTRITV